MEDEGTLKPLAVKRTTAARMLECGQTSIWKLEKSGDLEVIFVGADRRITIQSIEAYIKRQLRQQHA